jgi:hypothetical protein
MIRDIAMIISVFVSVVSVGFGVYEGFRANNTQAFIYEQAYRIMGTVQKANISSAAKAQITDEALSALGTPAPVIDLSRSSADVGSTETCTESQKTVCTDLASQLAAANAKCKGSSPECQTVSALKKDIASKSCYVCFTK